MDPTSVPTRDEVLWRVDCIITWPAPDCALPGPLQGPELNIIVGKGAYKFDAPRHLMRLGFEINAPDEHQALERARSDLAEHFQAMEERHGDDDPLPEDIDLHPDRIVVDRLAVRQVVTAPVPAETSPPDTR